MPLDASRTREKLIDEAARAFAKHGVYGASLIDITRRAGQRNRGALHYHFGSRTGVLCAVLERHVDFLARREGELLELALESPTTTSSRWSRRSCARRPSSPRAAGGVGAS